MNRIIPLLACVLMLLSCNNNGSENKYSKGFGVDLEEPLVSNQAQHIPISIGDDAEVVQSDKTNSTKQKNKIIKQGQMNFEVKKLKQAKLKIDSILQNANGYYENEEYKAYGNRKTYTLKLRIPNDKFDSLVYVLEKGIGNLTSKNISAKDVTEEYVDLNIRLENNLSYLKQYKTILAKANTIKEILEVKEKIRQIEEEIESKKGRIKFLDDKVNFSTLNIEISEFSIAEISKVPGFGLRIVNAFKNGFDSFLSFIIVLINLWPFLILTSLLVFVRKPILNSIRSRKKESK